MKAAKNYFVIVILLCCRQLFPQAPGCQQYHKAAQTYSLYYSAANHRSDTIDILKYTINLDITNLSGQTIAGNTMVTFAPKINGQNRLRLDLLRLTIDSIRNSSALLSYTYNDTLLNVILPTALNTTDTTAVTVYYHGHPQGDASGWGGFYFSGNYAYNLGVGFAADPHCYGRVWFPCFDNFVEKAKFEFNITTDTTRAAYCNGQLMSDVKTGGKRTRSWIMNKPITSYLASVAVADYTQVNWSFNLMSGPVPVILAARAPDTTALKSGFVHLFNAVSGYENYYGPYVWNRIGYCLVPFNSGAMEHATNIAYPQVVAGMIAYESELMAHELSHHWWGDHVTCETQEDMWLNEGMATYSQRLFYEYTYNHQRYMDDVKSVHDDIVKYIHLREKGFRPVSGVPHQYTYGDHVYKKGADVAHTLRSYMGDTAFFAGLKYVQQHKAYLNLNSLEFRDLLQTSSGQNLTNFFNNWVFTGGWPHFSIDSVRTTGAAAPYTSVVYVKQKLFGAPALFANVPLEITFMNSAWAKEIKSIVMNGATKSFTVQTNVAPAFTGMNVDSKISDAISSEYKAIKASGIITYTLGGATLLVSSSGTDSSYIRIEHNFAAPDPVKVNLHNYRLNTQHYWKVDGLLSPGFASKLRMNYDGNKTTSGISYLDTCLINTNGDSLILLYRRNAADDWQEVQHYSKFKSSTRTGIITADTLKLGEYVFANGRSSVLLGIGEKAKDHFGMTVYPNPSEGVVNIAVKELRPDMVCEVYNIQGRLVHTQKISDLLTKIDCSGWGTGSYIVKMKDRRAVLQSQTLVIQ